MFPLAKDVKLFKDHSPIAAKDVKLKEGGPATDCKYYLDDPLVGDACICPANRNMVCEGKCVFYDKEVK
jgi:hypothetical protein